MYNLLVAYLYCLGDLNTSIFYGSVVEPGGCAIHIPMSANVCRELHSVGRYP